MQQFLGLFGPYYHGLERLLSSALLRISPSTCFTTFNLYVILRGAKIGSPIGQRLGVVALLCCLTSLSVQPTNLSAHVTQRWKCTGTVIIERALWILKIIPQCQSPFTNFKTQSGSDVAVVTFARIKWRLESERQICSSQNTLSRGDFLTIWLESCASYLPLVFGGGGGHGMWLHWRVVHALYDFWEDEFS